MKIHESGENYLETILLLGKKRDIVRSIDIATELNYSKPSISRAMGILKKNHYITVASNGAITLTEKGYAVASRMYERHQLLTKCLISIGVSEKVAAEDACRIEHVISEESFEKLKTYIETQNKDLI